MATRGLINSSLVGWMSGDGPESDVVITCRVRLARNVNGLPFPHLLGETKKADEVIMRVQKALKILPGMDFTLCSQLTDIERQILLEKHLISPELSRSSSSKSGIITNQKGSLIIMINEEDHVRIQCLLPGLQLNQAYKYADDMDNALEKELEFAFDQQRGYLTSCPTNVGTGMRASVMLHLPAIAMANQQGRVFNSIAQLGLTVRGIYGEGTESLGNFYQISNQITLGQNEEDIINNLWTITLHILEQERGIRNQLLQERRHQIEDRIWRAYGILTNSRIITSNEALTLLSDVRLGSDLGILPEIPRGVLNELMIALKPAHLQLAAGREMNPLERDITRAQIIKDILCRKKEG